MAAVSLVVDVVCAVQSGHTPVAVAGKVLGVLYRFPATWQSTSGELAAIAVASDKLREPTTNADRQESWETITAALHRLINEVHGEGDLPSH